MGYAGLKNGKLLDKAEAKGFNVLVTAVSWTVIESKVASIIEAIGVAAPGSFTRVDVGTFRRLSKLPKKGS